MKKTGALVRNGIAGKMNPYNRYALETALRLREKNGGRVVVGTMGPPQAEAIVREAYMMGADCTTLQLREDTGLVQIRPAFGGNIMAQIVTPNTRPQFATVRYKVMNPPVRQETGRAKSA